LLDPTPNRKKRPSNIQQAVRLRDPQEIRWKKLFATADTRSGTGQIREKLAVRARDKNVMLYEIGREFEHRSVQLEAEIEVGAVAGRNNYHVTNQREHSRETNLAIRHQRIGGTSYVNLIVSVSP
jgi:hypothetical protein